MSATATAVASAKPQTEDIKTPKYAWVALALTTLCSIAIVETWFWPVGVTFPNMFSWWGQNSPEVMGFMKSGGSAYIMGLTPIAAMIMAIPTSWIVRKWGVKIAISAGMIVAILSGAGQALCITNSVAFIVFRCLYGAGIAMTAVSGPTAVSIWFPNATRGRAMGIWSCWVPIGLIIINNAGTGIYGMLGSSLPNFVWFTVAILVIVEVLFLVFFRLPRADESSQVSAERKPFKEIMHFFKSRQLWCLIIAFMIFNFMNYNFSTYLKTWMAADAASGGLGMDAALAGLAAGLITACGILAPIGGILLDKTPKDKQYLLVVVGVAALTGCCVFAYQANTAFFVLYIVLFCIGNMLLNACCRPLVPSFLFKGGATAVAMGLSFLTCAQYLGQVPMSFIMEAIAGGAGNVGMFAQATLIGFVPVGIVGIILAFLVKPSSKVKTDANAAAAKPAAE
jgi:MFS family permease